MSLSTPATAALDAAGVAYRVNHYEAAKTAEEAAERRGIELRQLVKTLVVRVEEGSYALVLIPGDRGLDYKKLRAHLGVRRLTMPDPDEAKAATGYERGTITPFGAGGWPVILDESLLDLEEISLGSGDHGAALHLTPQDTVTTTDAVVVDITKEAS